MRTAREQAEEIVRGWHVSDGFPELTDAIAAALEERETKMLEWCAKNDQAAFEAYQSEKERESRESWRADIQSKWGHKIEGECGCAYCRRDVDVVFEHAAELEMKEAYLEEQLAEAVKLLQPFADCAAFWSDNTPDFHSIASASDDGKASYQVTLGQARAAASFLTKHTPAEKPDGKLQKPLDTHAKPL